MVKLCATKQSRYVLVFVGDFLVRKSRQKTQNKIPFPKQSMGRGILVSIRERTVYITRKSLSISANSCSNTLVRYKRGY